MKYVSEMRKRIILLPIEGREKKKRLKVFRLWNKLRYSIHGCIIQYYNAEDNIMVLCDPWFRNNIQRKCEHASLNASGYFYQ